MLKTLFLLWVLCEYNKYFSALRHIPDFLLKLKAVS